MGFDFLFGGDGADVAVFSGARSLYDVIQVGEVVTVTARAGGATTTLTGVETLRFAAEAPVPVIVVRPDVASHGEDDPARALAVLANDGGGAGPLQLLWVRQPSAGRASLSGSGVLFETLGAFNGLKAGETATVELLYGVGDGITGAVGAATITVVGANDGPVALGSAGGGDPLPFEAPVVVEDAPPLKIPVLDGFLDPDGDRLFISAVSALARGMARIEGDSILFDQQGAFDGLKAGEIDTVAIGYAVSDGIIDVAGDVKVTIVGKNDSPTAAPDSGQGFSTTALAAFSTADVLVNDADPDADALFVSDMDVSGTLGAVTHLGGGTFRYDPDGRFAHLRPGETAIDPFSYVVSDAAGGTSSATVEIEVAGVAPPTQRIVVYATGQSYLGDPVFDLVVNGVTVAQRAVESPAQRLAREDRLYAAYAFEIDAGIDIESVAVVYREDAWSGSRGAGDRNLFVGAVEFGGQTYSAGSRSRFTPSNGPDLDKELLVSLTGDMFWAGSLEFSDRDDGPPDPGGVGADPVRLITVYAAGQHYLGDPQFRLSVNGRFVGDAVEAPSQPGRLSDKEAEAAAEAFVFAVRADLPLETIGVTFVNDRYGGAPDADRNFYLSRIVVDDVVLRPADGAISIGPRTAAIREAAEERGMMFSTGTLLFNVSDLFAG